MEKKKILWNNYTWVGIVIFIIIIALIIMIYNKNFIKQAENKLITEITEDNIIEFAKQEIKTKLEYPDTASFSKEKITFQEDKYIIECYCTSNNRNKQETKVKFITIVQIENNNLKCIDMMTNGETCTKDAKEIVEELIKKGEYRKIYDDWFNSTEKYAMSYDKFINYLNKYPIDLQKATFKEEEFQENKKIILYIEEKNNKDREYKWYFSFLNGQVYLFDVILNY